MIGLTQRISNSNLYKPLCTETLQKTEVCKMLHEMILANTSPLQVGTDQIFFVKLSKTLELYSTLLDLKAKSKDTVTDYGSTQFQVDVLNRVAYLLIQEITGSTLDSMMAKMTIVVLSKEANRDSCLVEEVLLKCYEQTGSKVQVIKAFFDADLLRERKSVELGFQMYASTKVENLWALKACFNCNKSTDLDSLILDFINQNHSNLSYANHLKPLIAQYSDTDAASVKRFVTLISNIKWTDRQTMLKCILHLTKLNK